ncbi:WD40-repeat-containing domain protein [Suillus lakei]|nr:WD40-repeat-containing domain protein [Suillus lakei]
MSFFARWIREKSNQHYKLLTRLTVSSGSVHALAISNDGQVLACGGTEGVKLWDINSCKELACSSHHHESQGTVSCAAWTLTRPTTTETLCYGTGLGYVVFLRRSVIDKQFQGICVRRLGSGFKITCLSWDSTSSEANTWIAVGMRDKIVQVLLLNANSQLQSIFAVWLDNTVPKSVVFAENYNIYIFGLYNGKFIKLEGKDGTVVREFSYEGEEPVQTFTTAVPSMLVPKQVAFREEGRVVAGGSDNSLVYIFDRKAGELLETLHHADGGLVQTIASKQVDSFWDETYNGDWEGIVHPSGVLYYFSRKTKTYTGTDIKRYSHDRLHSLNNWTDAAHRRLQEDMWFLVIEPLAKQDGDYYEYYFCFFGGVRSHGGGTINSHSVEGLKRKRTLPLLLVTAAMLGVPALVLEHVGNIHVDGIINSLNIRQFIDRFNDDNLKHGTLSKSTYSIIKAGVIMAVDASILAIPDFGSQVITRTLCSLSLIFSVHCILAGVAARHFGEMMKSLEFASQHLNDKRTRVAVIYSTPSLLWTTR